MCWCAKKRDVNYAFTRLWCHIENVLYVDFKICSSFFFKLSISRSREATQSWFSLDQKYCKITVIVSIPLRNFIFLILLLSNSYQLPDVVTKMNIYTVLCIFLKRACKTLFSVFSFSDRLANCIIYKPQFKLRAVLNLRRPFMK